MKFLGAGALAAAFPQSIKKALAVPAHNQHGSIEDIEHIVILMQENRSFDHYFGTMRGVRGFGDPRAVRLPSGEPVWNQPDGAARVLPFRPDVPDMGLAFLEDTAHNWADTIQAWNNGKYDQWVPQKGTTTMAHLLRKDIPFHFALADAFTICDAYHCSFMGATDPNCLRPRPLHAHKACRPSTPPTSCSLATPSTLSPALTVSASEFR